MDRNRRTLLAAAGGFAAALLAPGRADAMQLDDLDAPRRRLLLSACETQATHRAAMAELAKRIEGEGVDADEARRRVAAMACPFCGCPFAALDLPAEGETPRF